MKTPDTYPAELRKAFPNLCQPKKPHHCRICDEIIKVAEPCCRWTGLMEGEGYFTAHAHPECYNYALKWDEGDWECMQPGDVSRKDIILNQSQ